MLLALIGLIAAAGVAAYWVAARRRARQTEPRTKKPAGRFGGVAIRVRSGACEAARALEGQRFLAKNAPSLPLPQCKAGRCSCSFEKLSDRRTEGRRLEHGGLSSAFFVASNRRKKRDRRRAQQAPQTK